MFQKVEKTRIPGQLRPAHPGDVVLVVVSSVDWSDIRLLYFASARFLGELKSSTHHPKAPCKLVLRDEDEVEHHCCKRNVSRAVRKWRSGDRDKARETLNDFRTVLTAQGCNLASLGSVHLTCLFSSSAVSSLPLYHLQMCSPSWDHKFLGPWWWPCIMFQCCT